VGTSAVRPGLGEPWALARFDNGSAGGFLPRTTGDSRQRQVHRGMADIYFFR